MARLLVTAETLAAALAPRVRPRATAVRAAVDGDHLRLELLGVAVPVIGRARVALSLRAEMAGDNLVRVWVRVERAAGVLTPVVRAFLKPVLTRLLRAAGVGHTAEVESRAGVLIRLDHIKLGQAWLTDLVAIRDVAAPARGYALGCDFLIRDQRARPDRDSPARADGGPDGLGVAVGPGVAGEPGPAGRGR